MRSVSQQQTAVIDAPQVQFPGIPDTTGQLAIVEVLNGSLHGEDDGQPPPPTSRGASSWRSRDPN